MCAYKLKCKQNFWAPQRQFTSTSIRHRLPGKSLRVFVSGTKDWMIKNLLNSGIVLAVVSVRGMIHYMEEIANPQIRALAFKILLQRHYSLEYEQ